MHQANCLSKKLTIALLGLGLSAGLVITAAAAPKGKAKEATAQEMVQQQHELLLNESKPSEEQQKALTEKFATKQEALAAWEKTNADKLKAAEEAAAAARKGSYASAKKSAAGTLKELTANRDLATAEADRAIEAILTEEQRASWAGAQMAQSTLRRLQRANLTAEQTEKIKSACVAAARDLAAFEGEDKKAKKGRTAVQKSLQWAIQNVVLTAEQRPSRAGRGGTK